MGVSKFIYRLGGATYDVIKHCGADTKIRYSNLAFSLLLSTILAAIGGYDIAHQFTSSRGYCIAVGILWGIAVFSFDFFLLNSGVVTGILKYIRIPVGLANVFITITALFVLLNQSTIDTKIRLTNATKVRQCDSAYLSGKEDRYSQVNDRKKDIDQYHQQNCVPEALNGHPGPEYNKKHSLCIATKIEIAQENTNLNNTEKIYVAAYKDEKDALLGITSNDFFNKARLLPGILSANKLVLILAVCLFIFLGYIELQSILMKFAIDPNDEYHIHLRTFDSEGKGIIKSKIENERSTERNKVLLDQRNSEDESNATFFDADIKSIDELVIKEYEVKGRIRIYRRKGYHTSAEQLQKKWGDFIAKNSSTPEGYKYIFKMSQSMMHQIEQIRKMSSRENISENIFNWIHTNISYDKEHSQEHYRSAKETYDERKGVCGELSVLYMAFLRAVDIGCNFCEVTKDNDDKEVAHACVLIKNANGTSHLSDVAYGTYKIEHKKYREFTDKQLQSKYQNWNQ